MYTFWNMQMIQVAQFFLIVEGLSSLIAFSVPNLLPRIVFPLSVFGVVAGFLSTMYLAKSGCRKFVDYLVPTVFMLFAIYVVIKSYA